MRSCHSALVERYKTGSSSAHLPYLAYSDPPIEHAKDLAIRCNARIVHAPIDGSAGVALDTSEKHIILLEFPSKEELDSGNLLDFFFFCINIANANLK